MVPAGSSHRFITYIYSSSIPCIATLNEGIWWTLKQTKYSSGLEICDQRSWGNVGSIMCCRYHYASSHSSQGHKPESQTLLQVLQSKVLKSLNAIFRVSSIIIIATVFRGYQSHTTFLFRNVSGFIIIIVSCNTAQENLHVTAIILCLHLKFSGQYSWILNTGKSTKNVLHVHRTSTYASNASCA
jgi:hypothetical protein